MGTHVVELLLKGSRHWGSTVDSLIIAECIDPILDYCESRSETGFFLTNVFLAEAMLILWGCVLWILHAPFLVRHGG